MRGKIKAFTLVIACAMLAGCYAHYPSIGVPGGRARATSWRGEVKVRCCYVVRNIDTDLKEYDCQDLYPSECKSLR
jgi:hypothetical protein